MAARFRSHLAAFALFFLLPASLHAQQAPLKFRLGGFVIRAQNAAHRAGAPGPLTPIAPGKLGVPPANSTLHGTGETTLHGQRVRVEFSGVRFTESVSGGVLTAVSGRAIGTNAAALVYVVDGATLAIPQRTLRITTSGAQATVSIDSPVAFAPRGTTVHLRADTASVWSDGSVTGSRFKGGGQFDLQASVYRITCPPDAFQSVRFGPRALLAGQVRRGIELHGTAAFKGETRSLFGAIASLAADGRQARLVLTLPGPCTRKPELGYQLDLDGGAVTYRYVDHAVTDCRGSFTGRLQIPPDRPGDQTPGDTFANLEFATDASGALFTSFRPAKRFDIGRTFQLATGDSGLAIVYFATWQPERPQSGYPKGDCASVFATLVPPNMPDADPFNASHRPGLTIANGTLWASLPQVTFGTPHMPAADFNLMARTTGLVTLTFWGWAGTLTTGGRSFVRSDSSLAMGDEPLGQTRASLTEIIDAGPGEPPRLPERFQLAGLRVLNLRARRLAFCGSHLMPGGLDRVLTYDVHFPYPTYVTLTFIDTTLDDTGHLREALGPEGTVGCSMDGSHPLPAGRLRSRALSLPGAMTLKRNIHPLPDAWILWKWRLPVDFAPLRVRVGYRANGQPTEVRVLSDTTLHTDQGIVANELEIPRLFSRHSGVRKGVRFGATLGVDGSFSIDELDTRPYLARVYAVPGLEHSAGFDVSLPTSASDGLQLSAEGSNAAGQPQFGWHGQVNLPFLGPRGMQFDVTDWLPRLRPVGALEDSGRRCCPTLIDSVVTYPECNDAGGLWIRANALSYDPLRSVFSATALTACDLLGMGTSQYERKPLRASALQIASFTSALLELDGDVHADADLVLSDTTVFDACAGAVRRVRTHLEHYRQGNMLRDLVCYDAEASAARGSTRPCDGAFVVGTYVSSVSDGEGHPEHDILVMPDTRVYLLGQKHHQLDVRNTDMTLQSESEDPHPTVLALPGATLDFTPDGKLGAEFETSFPLGDDAIQCNAHVAFYLDAHCGHFFVEGTGAFTYGLTFTGGLFIVHAPLGSFYGGSDMLPTSADAFEDLAHASYCSDVAMFAYDLLGLPKQAPKTLVTGVFASGGVGWNKAVGPIELSANAAMGVGAFELRDDTGDRYQGTVFMNIVGSADLEIAEICASADLRVIPGYGPGDGGSGLSWRMGGDLCLWGCIGCPLGHCDAWVRGGITYSSVDGFDTSGVDFGGGFGGGGCGSSACPGACGSAQ